MKQPSRAMTWVTTLCQLSDPEPASHLVAFLIGLQATSVTSQASGCMGPSEAGANRGLGMVMVQNVFASIISSGDHELCWPSFSIFSTFLMLFLVVVCYGESMM